MATQSPAAFAQLTNSKNIQHQSYYRSIANV